MADTREILFVAVADDEDGASLIEAFADEADAKTLCKELAEERLKQEQEEDTDYEALPEDDKPDIHETSCRYDGADGYRVVRGTDVVAEYRVERCPLNRRT